MQPTPHQARRNGLPRGAPKLYHGAVGWNREKMPLPQAGAQAARASEDASMPEPTTPCLGQACHARTKQPTLTPPVWIEQAG